MQRLRYIARAACVLVALAHIGCGSSTLNGRYYSEAVRGEWLEFRGDGTVVHGSSGDAARYRLDGDTVVIVAPSGNITGQIAGPSTIRFGDDVAAFAGVWVASGASGSAQQVEASPATTAGLLGHWRIPGETHVLDLRPDGTYTWGPDLSGTYRVLEGARIRRSVVQRGQMLNPALEEKFIVDAGMLRLTMPDGSVTTYERAN